ncbi:MAG TPA: tripartite tricarboxylate transporter TctB family protein [Pseudonocardiaceae bacterium]|jgi:putative tricarboxylic transport membrane protein|nr:tripartite tricarboxylate transporter TctB family protein [Pseudonocardiaceae bacterium]
MHRADVVAGAAVAALGAFALVTALNLAFLSNSGVPGPGFFPTLLSGLLVVLGVLLAVFALRTRQVVASGPDTGDVTDVESAEGEDEPSQGRRALRAGGVWLCFAVAVPVLTVLGFVPAMAILIAVLLFGVERRYSWRSLVLAVVVPVAVFELFVHVLTIPLPGGLLALGPLSS